MCVYGTEDARRLVQVIADKTNDNNIKLPILVLNRTQGFIIKNPNKKPLTFDGLHIDNKAEIEYNYLKYQFENGLITKEEFDKLYKEYRSLSEDDTIISLNAIPISIPYTLDIYTRYQKENDLYVRNLVFNIINYPTFQVNFKYNGIDVQHNSNLILNDRVTPSTPSIKLFPDQICKQSLSITVDDAYLWDIRIRSSISIEGSSIQVKNNNDEDFTIDPFSVPLDPSDSTPIKIPDNLVDYAIVDEGHAG